MTSSTINNDEFPATFDIRPTMLSRNEGDAGQWGFQFLVERSGITDANQIIGWRVVLPDDGTLTAEDFATSTLSGTLRFDPSHSTAILTLPIRGDLTPEGPEPLTVEIFNVNNDGNVTIGTARATATILDDDSPFSIVADTPSRLEGEAGLTPFTFTVSRAGLATTAQEVTWQVIRGDAVFTASTADFAADKLSGLLRFEVGETSRTLTIDVAADTEWELDERFAVDLGSTASDVRIGPGARRRPS